jgi:hypothetical protein
MAVLSKVVEKVDDCQLTIGEGLDPSETSRRNKRRWRKKMEEDGGIWRKKVEEDDQKSR